MPRRVTLDELRAKKRMTQMQLASESGLSWSTIAQLELGKHAPSPATLDRLASVLGEQVRAAKWAWAKEYKRRGRPRRDAGAGMREES